MNVRLGFAAAANLEPDILLVDEVLAIGDAAFREKCVCKMDEVAAEGRTVVFVSHNVGSIANLCFRVLLLDAERIALLGDTSAVISDYILKRENRAEKSVRQMLRKLLVMRMYALKP